MEQPIEHILSHPIILSDHILRAVTNTKSYNLEFTEITKLVEKLSQMIRSFILCTNSTSSVYDRPVRCIFGDVTTSLTRTLKLVRKCRRQSIFVRFVYIVNAADFRKLTNLLEASIGNMTWLLSIFDDVVSSPGVVLSLPPIASNDPTIAWVWSYITSLYLYNQLNLKIEVIANELNSLANDNDRNKTIIVQEGGIVALLKLMNEYLSPETLISVADILSNLANNQERARLITRELGVPIIVQCFQKSSIRVQISVAKLIARMAENDVASQDMFASENVIRRIVTLLSFEINVGDDFRNQYGKPSICSIVEINKENSRSFSSTSKWSIDRKERENEPDELKLELKTCCAKTLLMLVKGNLENCKILTDTKGLLILAKLIETETGELQTNCLKNVMEITALAESNSDLKRAAFKTNSPSSKEVVKQLLKIIQESEDCGIKIMAIRSIGSLASTFPARETRVIAPLVDQLSHENPDVGMESAIALTKFTSHDNFLSVEHSKTIIEFDGLVPLMRLVRGDERTQYYAIVLLCYLAMFGGNSVALVHARVLKVLEGVEKSNVGQLLKLKDLVVEAMYHLNMYHANVVSSQRKTYSLGRI